MDKSPKHYKHSRIPDLNFNLFREKLSVEAAMELDKLIRWQYQRELSHINYDDETTRKFFDGTLRKRD